MTIYENQLFERCIITLIAVQEKLELSTIDKLIQKATGGKSDTLLLDSYPESIIQNTLIDEYDKDIVFVTEEIDSYNIDKISDAKIVVFADPTDRTKYFQKYLKGILSLLKAEERKKATFGEIISNKK